MWTSISGITNVIDGNNCWYLNMKRCARDGQESRSAIYHLSGHIEKLPYEFWNESIIIKVEGFMKLDVVALEPIQIRTMLLNGLREENDTKIYEGKLHLVGYHLWQKQKAHIGVQLTIPRFGAPSLQNFVYVGSWGAALECVIAESSLTFLKIIE